jgi:anti-sigma factor RsiW
MTGRKRLFAAEEWVDFVNGHLSTERMQTMQRHLETDCKACAKVVELWQQVRQTARRESRYEAPESAVTHVRNAFVAAQPIGNKRPFAIPRLVFDSLWQPAAVGVRAAHSTPRRLIYKAGEITIEMQIEPELHSERLNIAGQVSNTAQQGQGLAEVRVSVSSSKGKLAEVATNQFGEFQLGFVPETGTRISFGGVGHDELTVPLEGRGIVIFHRN